MHVAMIKSAFALVDFFGFRHIVSCDFNSATEITTLPLLKWDYFKSTIKTRGAQYLLDLNVFALWLRKQLLSLSKMQIHCLWQ